MRAPYCAPPTSKSTGRDSRAVGPGFLFAALPGTRADGIAYSPSDGHIFLQGDSPSNRVYEFAPAVDSDVRVITVLGMHRSGTSSLVGSLEEAGLPLGDVRDTGGDSNEKGHREPGELIALHDDVLITSGGAWHLPPAEARWNVRRM